MNRLPRVLITLATAFCCFPCALAQTPAPLVVPENESRRAAKAEPAAADDGAEDAAREKALLRFEGLRFLREPDARKLLREERAGVDDTFAYDPARIEKVVAALKKHYARHGFLGASFDVKEEALETPRLVTLVVTEGERARLEEIRFEGGARVPGVRLEEAARKCLAGVADDGKDWRDEYDYDRLEYCARDARRVLAGEGFLQAKVGEPEVEPHGRGLRATVRVEEGTRYRYGRVRVKGVTAFLPEQIVEMFDARPGEVADGRKIVSVLSGRLNEEYGDRGYLRYSYDVTPTYRKSAKRKGEGFVDLRIDISEGACFTVSSVSFSGHRLKTEDELRAALSLREGDVFSTRRLDDGLRRLYEIGALGENRGESPPSSWQGVEINLDEERGRVAVRIRVSEPQYGVPTGARAR